MSIWKPRRYLVDVSRVKPEIARQLPAIYERSKRRPIYIDGTRYKSLFEAGIESGIDYRAICAAIKESDGGPIPVRGHMVVTEEWAVAHKEFFCERETTAANH